MMKYLLSSKITVITIGFAVHLSGCASNGFETWNTEITCDQQHFTITSFCTPSKDPETMNTCKGEQLLAKGDQTPVNLPLAATRAINKELLATHWKCQQVGNTSYLEIRYAAGLGTIPGNEAVEFFDLQSRPVTDQSLQNSIIRTGKKTNKGRVKSIMPEQ